MFKELVWGPLVKAAIARLFAALPWLGWGPIGVAASWVLTYFADKLYEAAELAINLELIYLRNESHRKEYDSACVELKKLGAAKGKDSPEWKAAYEVQKASLAKFVRFAVGK